MTEIDYIEKVKKLIEGEGFKPSSIKLDNKFDFVYERQNEKSKTFVASLHTYIVLWEEDKEFQSCAERYPVDYFLEDAHTIIELSPTYMNLQKKKLEGKLDVPLYIGHNINIRK